jgi:porin
MTYPHTRKSVSGLLAFGMAAAAHAGGVIDTETSPQSGLRSFLEQDYLLGDWGGLRTKLSESGVDFEFFYAGSVPVNTSGGLDTGAVYQGALLMSAELNSAKLLGYEGGVFHVSSLWLHGEKPFSEHYVGDLNKVNLIDFPNMFRLWELYYSQTFFDGKLQLKGGQLSIDRDFIVPELYNSLGSVTLLNQTFFYPTMAFNVWDVPGLPVRNHGLASTPYATPGFLVRVEPLDRSYVQAAVYGGNPDQSSSGTSFNLSEREGALAYFELGYKLNQKPDDRGLRGSYKAGGYYHTAEFVGMYEGVLGAYLGAAGIPTPPPERFDGNHGWYVLAEQQVFSELGNEDASKQGLVGFFRLGGAPQDRNLAEFGVDGGLVYKGLIPHRDWDTLAVAGSYLEISDDLRRAQRDVNALAPGSVVEADYEAVLEVSYKFQVTAWWTLQPSFQHVFHPGGSSAIEDASVFIVQTTLRF